LLDSNTTPHLASFHQKEEKGEGYKQKLAVITSIKILENPGKSRDNSLFFLKTAFSFLTVQP